MVDRPILFSAPMVRALLDGRKTQTRRMLSISGHRAFSEFGVSDTPGYDWHFRDAEARWHDLRHSELLARLRWQVGDRLWVKERFTVQQVNRYYSMDGRHVSTCIDFDAGPAGYEARQWVKTMEPDTQKILQAVKQRKDGTRPLVPGIFLPRIASRLTLTVTDVRVERLQDISEEDAIVEGIEFRDGCWGIWEPDGTMKCGGLPDPIEAYRCLWLNINGAGSWGENPWIVAVSFSVERRNIDG